MRQIPASRQELERQNTSQLLRIPYQLFIERLFTRLTEVGFTGIHPAHATVFQHVATDGIRVTDLARRSQLTKQYVGRLVADLEGQGFLERAEDPSDGRAKLVRLSSRGQELTRAAEEIITEIEADWARRVGQPRHTELRRALVDLILSLEK